MEEQFYVLLPAVVLAIAACRRSLLWAWVLVAASFAAGMLVRSYLWDEYVQVPRGGLGYYKYIYYASWCRCDELVAGVALALLKNHHPAAWRRITSYGNRTLVAGLAGAALMLVLFYHHHFDYWVTVLGYPALAASISLLLVAALSPGSALYKVRVPGAASLALWSYAIYLLHKQLCILLSPVLQGQGYAPDGLPAVLIMIAVSIGTGWLLYSLVETPFMRLRTRYFTAHYR